MTDRLEDTTALTLSGAEVGDALRLRAGVMEMTQAAEDAVLAPKETGPWSHDLRAALAARIARLNGDEALAAHYAGRIGDEGVARLADPGVDGSAQGLAEVVAFMDRVAAHTRNVTAADIQMLKDAGVADADIVRLAELNAFLAYQVRLIAGLRLMRGAA